MQFLFINESGNKTIVLKYEPFRYIVKARRVKKNSIITTRNLYDGFLYRYEIIDIAKKSATLELLSKEQSISSSKDLHIGWCIIDSKIVEKSIPMLNQIGVQKITFIDSDFSQKNFNISIERIKKIVINSCEQSGRDNLMKFDFSSSIVDFLKKNSDCVILDFNANSSFEKEDIKTLLIGCEGGFSKEEREFFKKRKIVSFKLGIILKSETAAISAASKIIL